MLDFLHDCRTATLHLEQARQQALPWATRLRLWAHLAYCRHCRRYARQSRLLDQVAHPAADPVATAALRQEARQRLQRALQAAGY